MQNRELKILKLAGKQIVEEWPGTESDSRHEDFQSSVPLQAQKTQLFFLLCSCFECGSRTANEPNNVFEPTSN